MALGVLHSTESFGSVDGPGVRFVIFLRGCALRCQYCHNADTWDMCPAGARRVTAEELLDKAERYKSYWGDTGGITVSGGEPLLQVDFLLSLFREAKRRGIHTVIDTAGQPFTRKEPFFSAFQELLKVTDLILLDMKHIDRERHMALTGQPNDNILDLFRYLDEVGQPIWVRHVLVPGITDDDSYLQRTRDFLDTLHNVQRVEVLPYHTLGRFKWEELGLSYPLAGVEPPTKERVENARRMLGCA